MAIAKFADGLHEKKVFMLMIHSWVERTLQREMTYEKHVSMECYHQYQIDLGDYRIMPFEVIVFHTKIITPDAFTVCIKFDDHRIPDDYEDINGRKQLIIK